MEETDGERVVETDSHEHEVEDLLRQVFDEARRQGGRDLSGSRLRRGPRRGGCAAGAASAPP